MEVMESPAGSGGWQTEMIDHCSSGGGRYSNHTQVSHPWSHLSPHTGTFGLWSPFSAAFTSVPQHADRIKLEEYLLLKTNWRNPRKERAKAHLCLRWRIGSSKVPETKLSLIYFRWHPRSYINHLLVSSLTHIWMLSLTKLDWASMNCLIHIFIFSPLWSSQVTVFIVRLQLMQNAAGHITHLLLLPFTGSKWNPL